MKTFQSILVGIFVLTSTFYAFPASAQPTHDNSEIIMTGTDVDGRSGPLRRGYWNGSTGTGADKLYYKHNIDNFSLFTIALRDPSPVQEDPPNGTVYQYMLPVGAFHCDDTYVGTIPKSGCRNGETEGAPMKYDVIRLLMDYRTNTTFPTSDTTYGVVTMYCTNAPSQECPDWVNTTARYPSQGPWPW